MNEDKENTEDSGLVISDKSDRSRFYEHTFPTPEKIADSAESFRKPTGFEEENSPSKHFISLSPASIQISKKSKIPSTKSQNYKARKQITEWSKKSRSNMVAVLCSLNYLPMFEGGGIPALVTLTYPKTWKTLCPTAKEAHRHLKLFRQRYERAFGKIRAIYKWEFQRSGSPHVHIFMVPPKTAEFRAWLSNTWAEIVGENNPLEFEKHVRAGTAIDYGKGLRSTDPKRLAVYFSKHSSANFGSKEYQNQPPDIWRKSGSVGRFWGRWGLERSVFSIEIAEQEAIFIARTLRRWSKANAKPRKVQVWRVNQRTGEVRSRKVNRRPRRLRFTQGFCAVNDGSVMGSDLARAVKVRFPLKDE